MKILRVWYGMQVFRQCVPPWGTNMWESALVELKAWLVERAYLWLECGWLLSGSIEREGRL